MLLSTNQELRLHIPSNAVDDVSILQGIIDNSEHDFLLDKLGRPLYNKLCEYYNGIEPIDFYQSVTDGTYQSDPWAVLLLNAQRMITNDALGRFAYQQVISVNGAGVNVVSGNDYGAADDRLLERGVNGYRKEAAIACNNLLTLLEVWATTAKSGISEDSPLYAMHKAMSDIVALWEQSHYYYLHGDLLIQSCAVLHQTYLDIYDNRDRFIRLLPDLHFIQDEYISDAFGEDLVAYLLGAEAIKNAAERTFAVKVKKKVCRLMTAYLEQRTTVLSIDKQRRQQAHDESVALKTNLLAFLTASQKSLPQSVAEKCPFYDIKQWEVADNSTPPTTSKEVAQTSTQQSNAPRTFRTKLIY